MEQTGQETVQHFEDELLEIDLREYLSLLWHKKWLIVALVVVAVLASYFLSQEMQRIYQTSTLVMVKESSGAEGLFSEQFSFLTAGKANKVATYTEMLKSRRILKQVIENLDLRDEETGELIASDSLKERISISAAGDTNLINITVTYPDPFLARDIANQLVEVFTVENQDLNRADLRSASQFVNEQLSNVQSRLTEVEEKLLAYKEEQGVVFPEEYGQRILEKLTALETSRAEAAIELEQASLSLASFQKQLATEEKEIISAKTISNNPVLASSQQRLSELEVQLAGLLEVYTEKHPQVIEIKGKIAEVKEIMANTVAEIVSSRQETINPLYQSLRERIITLQTQVLSLEAQLNAYDEQIARLEQELSTLPQKELALARLQRESKVAESIYLLLMERREELQIQEAMQSSDLIVVDPAIVEEEPIKPNVKLNVAIAAVLAVFLGVFIIFLLEYLDNTVKEEKDLERLTGLPVLGVVPRFDSIDHARVYGRNEG